MQHAIETTPARIVYRGGVEETVNLISVPTGWRIASVPLGSQAIAFGDYVTVREEQGRLRVIGVRAGGWRTLRSRTVIPPDERLLQEIASRGWLAAWNVDGYLSLGVPMEVKMEARTLLDQWEKQAARRRESV